MPKRILLADDSITIQKVVELTFSDGDYEVVAVNNGAKAIQKLAEMRPDIILSDIIMPEKNGYEVCEYVKSHPEYRTIPVVLLTGTFEPFDPDRADKAGCDAVVTKPFESQSLIHKVDELIQQAQSGAGRRTAAPQPEPEPEPARQPLAVGRRNGGHRRLAVRRQRAGIRSRAAAAMRSPPASSRTATTSSAPRRARSPRAPQRRCRSRRHRPRRSAARRAHSRRCRSRICSRWRNRSSPHRRLRHRLHEPEPASSPFNDAAPAFGGETRAFPRMSFEELEKMTEQPAPPPPPAPPRPSRCRGKSRRRRSAARTRAFPSFSLDESPQAAAPEPPPAVHEPESPFGEEMPAFAGETRAFTKMSFEDLQQMAPQPGAAPTMSPNRTEPEPQRADSPVFEEPLPRRRRRWNRRSRRRTPSLSQNQQSRFARRRDFADEVIERIARRVVQMLSADEVKKIAWEVIPDMAEMVVKERIRQLESEA